MKNVYKIIIVKDATNTIYRREKKRKTFKTTQQSAEEIEVKNIYCNSFQF